jgi:hypothetical protein
MILKNLTLKCINESPTFESKFVLDRYSNQIRNLKTLRKLFRELDENIVTHEQVYI